MNEKTIALCSDHAGYELKEYVKTWLDSHHLPYKDFGTYSPESCDYADFAHPMAEAMEAGDYFPGIAICGSGNGIAMTLNKHQSIRAAICWNTDIASLARRHNDANILVLPGRFVTNEEADKILDTFFASEFEGGRHLRRINKIPVSR